MPSQSTRPQSYASLPGQMDVQFSVWARCFPGQIALPVAGVVLLLALGIGSLIFSGEKGMAPAAIVCLLIYRIWRSVMRPYKRIQRQFQGGCVTPARVVAPNMIAVYTDLSTNSQNGSWPAIKILTQPLGKAPGRALQVGDRLAAVALYKGTANKPHWDDFFPVAANCVTADEVALQRLLADLDAEDGEWENLDRYLGDVVTKTRPGLYLMRRM
jgi:hypothetical protein